MSKIKLTYDRISRYLGDLLSNRERHDLEKEMMQDVFDEEAFEGFNQLTANEFDSDRSNLMDRMDHRMNRDKKKNRIWYYRIAAGIILVAGLGTVLYVLMKPPQTEMITQRTTKEEAPETVIPSAPIIHEIESMAVDDPEGIIVRPVEKNEMLPQAVESIEENPEIVTDEIYDSEITEEDTRIAAPQLSDPYQSIADSLMDMQPQYVTGRVLGVNREALAGVSIIEKGTTKGTISDMDGNFRLQVRDRSTRLTLSYIGYRPVELPTSEIAGKEISLDEDLVALSEVVVIGYGTQNKSRADGAALKTAKKAQTVSTAPFIYSKPIPPGETMLQFEKWVEERIDTEKFMDLLPGNYKIRVALVVNPDGTLGNITVKDDVPEVVTGEYKRIVAQSPAWQPALKDKMPVEAEVMIIFSLKVE